MRGNDEITTQKWTRITNCSECASDLLHLQNSAKYSTQSKATKRTPAAYFDKVCVLQCWNCPCRLIGLQHYTANKHGNRGARSRAGIWNSGQLQHFAYIMAVAVGVCHTHPAMVDTRGSIPLLSKGDCANSPQHRAMRIASTSLISHSMRLHHRRRLHSEVSLPR